MVQVDRAVLRTVILAVGIAAAGWLAGDGLARSRAADRCVTVKGVTERDVKADLAIWPPPVHSADNELSAGHAKLAQSMAGVRRFLAKHGLDTTQVELTDFSVNDASSNQYNGGNKPTYRFVIRQTMMLRSSKPELVLAASQAIGELAAVGVVISSGGEYGPGGGPTFVFSGLNKLKPEMIKEATARARESAEQFAIDSRSALAGIRTANQGVFEILPRDQAAGISEASQISKRVRVVSTVEYFLKN